MDNTALVVLVRVIVGFVLVRPVDLHDVVGIDDEHFLIVHQRDRDELAVFVVELLHAVRGEGRAVVD